MAKATKTLPTKISSETSKEIKTTADVPTKRSENFISTYANIVKVSANPYDISILFSAITADGIEEKAMIQMSIQGLKGISKILSDVASDWDEEFSND